MVTHGSGDRRGLACIPSSDSIERRIATLKEEARKLQILLRTAKELEADRSSNSEGDDES